MKFLPITPVVDVQVVCHVLPATTEIEIRIPSRLESVPKAVVLGRNVPAKSAAVQGKFCCSAMRWLGNVCHKSCVLQLEFLHVSSIFKMQWQCLFVHKV